MDLDLRQGKTLVRFRTPTAIPQRVFDQACRVLGWTLATEAFGQDDVGAQYPLYAAIQGPQSLLYDPRLGNLTWVHEIPTDWKFLEEFLEKVESLAKLRQGDMLFFEFLTGKCKGLRDQKIGA